MKKTIYLAGGCFWGMQAYFQKIQGILSTECGYANGNTVHPSYEKVCRNNTGHAETVKIEYEDTVLPLKNLLRYYFRVIDPTSLNKQGNDVIPAFLQVIPGSLVRVPILLLATNYRGCARCGT